MVYDCQNKYSSVTHKIKGGLTYTTRTNAPFDISTFLVNFPSETRTKYNDRRRPFESNLTNGKSTEKECLPVGSIVANERNDHGTPSNRRDSAIDNGIQNSSKVAGLASFSGHISLIMQNDSVTDNDKINKCSMCSS